MRVALVPVVLFCVAAGSAQAGRIDFADGSLLGWVGHGFYLTTATGRGPAATFAVCSSDAGTPRGTAERRQTFAVPAGAGRVVCAAYGRWAPGCPPDGRLDVSLLHNGTPLPRLVRGAAGWEPAPTLLPSANGRPREYAWDVAGYVGRTLEVVLTDRDGRPGCHLFCTGLHVYAGSASPARATAGPPDEFARFMKGLESGHGLDPFERFDSNFFTAWSNAGAVFTAGRLRNCDMLYRLFLDHFGRRGFDVRVPAHKLMVAVFDSEEGFEAYMGTPMPSGITGVYSRATNRLVLYDVSRNQALLAGKKAALAEGRHIGLDAARLQYEATVRREAGELSADLNVSTAAHEAAHHVSFNCGLLNRTGDVPLWLAEGLACYCEATSHGSWQGIGEPNPERLRALARMQERGDRPVPLAALLRSDGWRDSSRDVLRGYAQSWALFHWLMKERPARLNAYLRAIHPRRTPDYRLADFCQHFGRDLNRLESDYWVYVRGLARRYPQGE